VIGPGFPRAATLAVGLAAGAAVVTAFSCLPDLQTEAPAVSSVRAPFCGDGVIDPTDGGEECDPGEAGAKGCTRRCVVECAGGFVDREAGTGHCYFSAGVAASDKAANTLCEAKGAHVVTFVSEDERTRLRDALDALDALDAGTYWVGLAYDPTAAAYVSAAPGEPGWKSGCAGCFAHLVGAGAFPKLRPDAAGDCVGDVDDAGSWVQLPCFTPPVAPVLAICEREPPGVAGVPCDGGSCIVLHETAATKRYRIGPDTVTAADAPGACAGGRLVVLASREEREALMRELGRLLGQPPLDPSVWIGLSRTDGGAWTWDDGQPLESYPRPWGDKQPRVTLGTARAYVSLATDYDIALARSDDRAQTAKHPALCEYAVTP
jgi:hypothetical protein